MADLTPLFSAPPSSDLFGQLLGFVFPDVPPIASTDGARHTAIASGIQDAMGTFLTDLAAVSLLVLSYQVVVGTAETAHQGELLGKKWHTMWSIPRVCYGFAALAPVVKGFCLLQVLVVSVVVLSCNVGNSMWSSFVSGLAAPHGITPPAPATSEVVYKAFKTETCFAGWQALQENTGAGKPAWPGKTQTETSFIYHPISTFYKAMSTLASGDSDSVTGGVTQAQTLTAWDFGPCGVATITNPAGASDAAGQLAKAQISAYEALLKGLQPVAEAVIKAGISGTDGTNFRGGMDSLSDLGDAKNTYDTALGDAVTSFVDDVRSSDMSDFQTAAQSAGWASAGAYYMTIARTNTLIATIAKNLPAMSYQASDIVGQQAKIFQEKVAPLSTAADEVWHEFVLPGGSANLTRAASANASTTGGAAALMKDIGSPDSYLQKAFLSASLSGDDDTYDALQDTVNLGNYLVDAGEVGLGVAVASPALNLVPGGKAVLAGVEAVKSSIGEDMAWAGKAALLAVLMAGIYDAFILPMLPYLHFFFATISVLILAVEGVIAAPIWAFMHVRMDGDELFTGAQSPGYKILFSLFFRIPLTIFGLFFSLLIFDAAIWLQHKTIWPAMQAATADATFGLVGTAVYIVVCTGMTYAIANRSFTMITAVPDRVTRWFGGESAASGDEGHTVNSSVGIIQNKASSVVKGAAGSAVGDKPKSTQKPAPDIPSDSSASTAKTHPAAAAAKELITE